MQRENSRLRLELEVEKMEADISLERFLIDFAEIKFDEGIEPLGKGATAVVLKATLFSQQVAVKKVSARTVDQEEECSRTLIQELRSCVSCVGCLGIERRSSTGIRPCNSSPFLPISIINRDNLSTEILWRQL